MNLPVEGMTVDECNRFIQKLNKLIGLSFRLPTEVEWEFAAHGGNLSQGYKYNYLWCCRIVFRDGAPLDSTGNVGIRLAL